MPAPPPGGGGCELLIFQEFQKFEAKTKPTSDKWRELEGLPVIAHRGVFPSPSPFTCPLPAFFEFNTHQKTHRSGCGCLGPASWCSDKSVGNDNGNGLGLGFKTVASFCFQLRKVGPPQGKIRQCG